MKVICINRKAKFDYNILDKYTAGLQLLGSEVKVVRQQQCSINEAYINFSLGRPVIYNMNIPQYAYSLDKYDPKRMRYLLLNKREINKLLGKLKQMPCTLIPLNVFISTTGYMKIEFGLCTGKKDFDKRVTIKEREWERKKTDMRKEFGKVKNAV